MMDGRTKRDPKQFSNSESIIEHADELFHSGGVDVVYEYLSSFVETLQDPDILWRFGRACGVMYKFLANDKQSRIEVVQRGLDALECALKINDKSSHILHWLGCLRGYELELNPLQLGNVQKCISCRDNFKLATELNPSDCEAWHSLGAWHYNILDRPFYERTLFSYLSGLSVKIEDGLPFLLKAEEVSVKPFATNWLCLAKCYLYINQKEEARKWLSRLVDLQHSGSTLDEHARRNAEKLLQEKFCAT